MKALLSCKHSFFQIGSLYTYSIRYFLSLSIFGVTFAFSICFFRCPCFFHIHTVFFVDRSTASSHINICLLVCCFVRTPKSVIRPNFRLQIWFLQSLGCVPSLSNTNPTTNRLHLLSLLHISLRSVVVLHTSIISDIWTLHNKKNRLISRQALFPYTDVTFTFFPLHTNISCFFLPLRTKFAIAARLGA